jgi:hypothetical protein
MTKFTFEDKWVVKTEDTVYGIKATIFDPNGKKIKSKLYLTCECQGNRQVAELMYNKYKVDPK